MIYCNANYVSLIAPQILDNLDNRGSPFRKCLHLLQKICGSRAVLPSTYEVSGELLVTTTLPIAYGGFYDVYKGTLSGENVCIKRLRISAAGDLAAVKRVAHFRIFDSIVKP